jgi:hypothetical protein
VQTEHISIRMSTVSASTLHWLVSALVEEPQAVTHHVVHLLHAYGAAGGGAAAAARAVVTWVTCTEHTLSITRTWVK